jgi:hypothetical protein
MSKVSLQSPLQIPTAHHALYSSEEAIPTQTMPSTLAYYFEHQEIQPTEKKGGGQNWIRTSEGVSQRIYSPMYV